MLTSEQWHEYCRDIDIGNPPFTDGPRIVADGPPLRGDFELGRLYTLSNGISVQDVYLKETKFGRRILDDYRNVEKSWGQAFWEVLSDLVLCS